MINGLLRLHIRMYTKHLAESTRKDLIYKPPTGILPPSYHPGIIKINDPKFIQELLKQQAKPIPGPKSAFIIAAIFLGFNLFIAWAYQKLPYNIVSNNSMMILDTQNNSITNLSTHPWCLIGSWLNYNGNFILYLPAIVFTCFNFKKYPKQKHRLFVTFNVSFIIICVLLSILITKFSPKQKCSVWNRHDYCFGETQSLMFLSSTAYWGSLYAKSMLCFYIPFQFYRILNKQQGGGNKLGVFIGPFLGIIYALISKRIINL